MNAVLAPLLEMRGISKRFAGVVALDEVDFEARAGEAVALVGENGAGKSTLMKIIGGVYQPDSSRIRLDGEPATISSVRDAQAYGIAFIHQELNVLDNLDVAGNVFLGREPLCGGWLKLIDRREMYEKTDVHLKHLGLSVSSRTPLSRLSIAERQIIEIAKALSQDARLLIMDEPTSSLTLTETRRLLDVVKELKAQGMSVIYISHRLGEIEEIADRVVVLRDGRNAGCLGREEISHDRMVQLMVGRKLKHEYVPPAAAAKPGYFDVKDLRTRKYPHRSVSFGVGRGEILGFAGLVGAGRSEVAQALFGVDEKLAGTLHLDDVPVRINAPQDAIRHGIYLIPEDRRRQGLILNTTIRENITLPALDKYASTGLIRSDIEKRAATDSCHRQNVKAASIETEAANLSGGNQQKVVLAKWLSLAPRVLIFDEPTRGIDVGAKAEIYALIRNLAAGGVCVMVISSDMEEVLGISDRIAVLREGELTGILARDGCTEEAVMRLAVTQK